MATSAPNTLGMPLATALDRSEPLTGLLQRMRGSRERLAALAVVLPSGLREGTRAGPLDESAWVLLVDNAAAAAKLRQMLPALQTALDAQGLGQPAMRIKIRPTTA